MDLDLDHVQMEQLSDALMDAFPTSESLKRMVYYKLGVQFGVVEGKNLPDTILNLIEHMRSKGGLEKLIRGACTANSDNVKLCNLARALHLITSNESLALPPLDLSVFEVAPRQRRKNELFDSTQFQLKMQPSKYYREELFIAPADARKFRISGKGQFVILQLQQFSFNDCTYAVRLIVDSQIETGVIACNQQFMAELRLDGNQPPPWSVLSVAQVVPLRECILELAGESGNLERDLEALQRGREYILLNRALFFEQGKTIQDVSLRADGWGYFNLHSITPDLSQVAPDTILAFDERTNLQLFASHSKSGVDMVVVVDGSGSMDITDYLGTNNSQLSRLKGVSLALEALIQRRLLAGSRVSRLAFVVFGQDAVMLYPPSQDTMIEIKNEQQIKEMSAHVMRHLTDIGVKKLGVDRNYSEISRALSYAANLLNYWHQQGNEKVLVLLSDGANNWKESVDANGYGEMVSPTADPAMLANTLREDSSIRIHTIAISNEQAYRRYCNLWGKQMHSGHTPNIALLRKIAQSTGGIFFESPDARVLTRLFEEMGQGVTYPLT